MPCSARICASRSWVTSAWTWSMPRQAASCWSEKGPVVVSGVVMAGMVGAVGSAGRRVGRRPGGSMMRCLGLLGGRDVEGELDLVGDEHVAAAEGLVELHVVVAAAELAGDLEADLLVAVGVDVDAVDLGGEDGHVGHALQRQVAHHPVGRLADRHGRGGLGAAA